ncbi:hypothetical protein FRC11_009489 [Ceratobasidium sp. 423]|nr:hypothetical protein FRC11_009489 [Ceratobasidium sp. 423]
MPRYNPCARKGRSPLQKEQMKKARMEALARRQNNQKVEPEPESSSTSNAAPYTQPLKTVKLTGTVLKDLQKSIEKLRKNHKNALQRERNAKMKINHLKRVANIKCEQLSELCEEQESTEIELQRLRLQANASAGEIFGLQEQIQQLKQQVSQSSQELVETSMNLKNQLSKSLKLEARNKALHRSQDALRKRFERIHTKMTQSQTRNVSTTTSSIEFNLKGRAGVIRPEVRDMLKNLASEGVSTKSISSIIDIIAQGLGIKVLGSVSTCSIARVMFEGLVEARMQLGYELDQAKSM